MLFSLALVQDNGGQALLRHLENWTFIEGPSVLLFLVILWRQNIHFPPAASPTEPSSRGLGLRQGVRSLQLFYCFFSVVSVEAVE